MGTLQPPNVVANKRIEELEQALWDIYGILGYDQDGDPTPAACKEGLIKLVVESAEEFRQEADELSMQYFTEHKSHE